MLDFDSAVEILREADRKGVTLTMWAPSFDSRQRPYRGRLRYRSRESNDDLAVFEVPTRPVDDRLVNPEGVKLAIWREGFGGAEWVGGPEPGAALSVLQGVVRHNFFFDPPDRTDAAGEHAGLDPIGRDPHGVSVSDDRTFVRWLPSPTPEGAHELYAETVAALARSARTLSGVPDECYGTDLVVRRVAYSTVVESEAIHAT